MPVRMPYGGPNATIGDGSSGGRLRDYLKGAGVSRKELARRTGLDPRTVSHICSGRREGNMATWRAIARALGCSLDDIVEA